MTSVLLRSNLSRYPRVTGHIAAAAESVFWEKAKLTKFLMDEKLKYEQFNGVSTMMLSYEEVSDKEVENDETLMTHKSLPLYMTHCMIKGEGTQESPSWATTSARAVADRIERMTACGSEDPPLTGILNVKNPQRITRKFVFQDGNVVDDLGISTEEMLSASLSTLISAGYNDDKFLVMYGNSWANMMEKKLGGKTIKQRLKDFEYLGSSLIKEVMHVEQLPASSFVVVALAPEVIRIVEGLCPRIVQGDQCKYFVTIIVPQIRKENGILIVNVESLETE